MKYSRKIKNSDQKTEVLAWRTLGEGMLLIDMYEQLAGEEYDGDVATQPFLREEPQIERALQWWQKLRL